MKKRIIIFGSTSFLAQNFINLDNKNKILGIIRNSNNKLIKKENVNYLLTKSFEVKKLHKIVNKFKPNILINFISNNNNSKKLEINNQKIIHDNVFPFLNILESVKELKLKIISFGSIETMKKEQSAYKLAKILQNKINNFYKDKYKLNITTIILPTIIGEFEKKQNRFLKLIINKKRIKNKEKVITFSFARDVITSLNNFINLNKKISLLIYKKKINYFINFKKIKKKNTFNEFEKKLSIVFNFYKNN